MKKTLSTTLAIIVLALGYLLYSNTRTAPDTTALSHYSSDVYGISFSYPSDYILTEQDITANGTKPYRQITLTNKKDLPPPANSEGPTAITIGFNAPDMKASASEGRISTITVSDLPAISYRWSGLYEGTTIVVTQPTTTYSFTVTYIEMGSDIVQDFVQIRESVKIVEPKNK